MKIGILGSTDVAKSLATGFVIEGHEVKLGSRQPDKLAGWISDVGNGTSAGTFSEAAQFGELIVLAVKGTASGNAVKIAGAENFKGKVVIDATNPLDYSEGRPPRLLGNLGSSGGELNQMAIPGAMLVKAFNTVGHTHFYKPEFSEGPPDMFICGDDSTAKAEVAEICKDWGWNAVDVGNIAVAHYLEATGMIWILTAMNGGSWNQAFKLIRQ